ncbi:CidA/LrgA family protein [Sporanaerobacter acetigenes]|uniref:Holin-like protein n=1 Tax=Sporanaerobacter acetigenes DSM 13106 TaxID=1123281 RepID=A0A1M5WH85_9FIRM|nr:CidA/LrgA family protein [Sporanaerobacter acetigenes]SHH86891.1 holin-like protein [Sporanaerobacter acetigenes DSM 13106]
MKILRQMGIIFGILFGSHILQKSLGLPIPSTVIGMIILLICLLSGVIKLEMIEEVSKFLLDHLIFFFIPAGVGIMTSVDMIGDKWLSILIVIVLSTIITMVVTGLTVQALAKKSKKKLKGENVND